MMTGVSVGAQTGGLLPSVVRHHCHNVTAYSDLVRLGTGQERGGCTTGLRVSGVILVGAVRSEGSCGGLRSYDLQTG